MENNLNDIVKFEVSHKLKDDLRAAATWARIIAIIAFCSSGLSLLVSISRGAFFGAIISAAISVFIYIYLLKFGSQVIKGIDANDQQTINEGLLNLRTYFKIVGVIIIIAIIICVLAIAFGTLGALIKM